MFPDTDTAAVWSFFVLSERSVEITLV